MIGVCSFYLTNQQKEKSLSKQISEEQFAKWLCNYQSHQSHDD